VVGSELALTLGFVARRLFAEPVGLVFAAREPGEELRYVPDLEVRGLRGGDARALLGSAVPFMLDERVRDRIIVETRGNPLALLELSRGLTATPLAGGFGMLPAQTLPGRIEEGFVRRLASRPEQARVLLLVATRHIRRSTTSAVVATCARSDVDTRSARDGREVVAIFDATHREGIQAYVDGSMPASENGSIRPSG
jgi:hypothetical protein